MILRSKRRVPRRTSGRKALLAGARMLSAATAFGAAALRTGVQAPAEPSCRAPGRFVELDGVRVHYIARGRGRPVVLLHGNGAMAEEFVISGLVDHLADRYRVIAVDRPGFGHTERPRHRAWTPTAQAELLHAVLERLKVDRPVIDAHSWGTLVALALAIADRRDLRGLLLLSGYYYPTARADVAASTPLAIPLVGDAIRAGTPHLARAMAPHFFRNVFQPQAVPARFTARFPVDVAFDSRQLRASAEDAALMSSAAAVLRHGYPGLRVPTTIMTGGADRIVDADEQSRRLHEGVAGSRLVVLPGVGHMIHYPAQAKIGRAVDALMAPPAPRPRSAAR